jgi:hypothetical protein
MSTNELSLTESPPGNPTLANTDGVLSSLCGFTNVVGANKLETRNLPSIST